MASDKCKIINITGICPNIKVYEFSLTSLDKLNMFSYGYEQIKAKLE